MVTDNSSVQYYSVGFFFVWRVADIKLDLSLIFEIIAFISLHCWSMMPRAAFSFNCTSSDFSLQDVGFLCGTYFV